MKRSHSLPQLMDAPWLFEGVAPITDGASVEIRGMRYRIFERAFEAQVIYEVDRRVLYRPSSDIPWYTMPWSEMLVMGRMTHIEIGANITRFRLLA